MPDQLHAVAAAAARRGWPGGRSPRGRSGVHRRRGRRRTGSPVRRTRPRRRCPGAASPSSARGRSRSADGELLGPDAERASSAESRARPARHAAGWRCRRSRRRRRWPAARRSRARVPTCSMRPSLKTAIRSLSVSASSWSWVTNRKVMPTSRWISLSSTCICSRSLRSRAPSGSSSSSTLGRLTSARASATRWRWPPESCVGLPVAEAGEADLLERLLRALASLGLADLLDEQAVLDVLLDAHVREDRVVLEDRVHVAVVRRPAGHVLAGELDRPGRRAARSRRSSAAPSSCPEPDGPSMEKNSPDRDGQVDVVDGDDRRTTGELLAQSAQADGRGSRPGRAFGGR